MKTRKTLWILGIGGAVLLAAGLMVTAWAQQAPSPADSGAPAPPRENVDQGTPPPPPPPPWHGMGAGRGTRGCPPGCPDYADADGDGRCDNFRDENGDGWCDNRPAGPPVRGFRGQGWGSDGTPPPPPPWHGTGAGRGVRGCPPGCPGYADADGDGRCDNFRDENGDGWCDNRPAGPPARGFRGPGRGYGGPWGRGRF